MNQPLQSDLADAGPDSSAIRSARRRLVACLCLVLAGLVLFGGSWWVLASSRFDVERIRTEAETVHKAMGGMLSMGLPVSDFIGFDAASGRVLRFDTAVRAVEIVDLTDRVVLRNPTDFDAGDREWTEGSFLGLGDELPGIEHHDWLSRYSLPVAGRFGPAGSIVLYYEHEILAEFTRSTAIAGFAALVLLALGVVVHAAVLANPEVFQSYRELATVYAVTCLIGLGIVGATIFGLGATKAIETANAYGESLGARLGEAMALGIDPSDLVGLGDVVREYQESNDIISYVALLEGNRIEAAAGLQDQSDRWMRPDGVFDAVIEVRPRRLYRPQYRVAVGIPLTVVTRVLWHTGTTAMLGAAALIALGLGLLAWVRVPEPSTVAPSTLRASA
ncbi:hypothetical protein T8K17_22015 [Thalassobaculum sp. OXR-137]|uniref:hypothetical protein n=1 Tax=Thalassobaculum sp. OXR-137 TaxID=3100173 RepID=UPI002AC953CB|nr:hypothetical protein [Thalassobaculum sp. OXR-137]WPZ33902.1 hypothetical protein T8K17_22015 [Thalassobaculum sp. OXR-137]